MPLLILMRKEILHSDTINHHIINIVLITLHPRVASCVHLIDQLRIRQTENIRTNSNSRSQLPVKVQMRQFASTLPCLQEAPNIGETSLPWAGKGLQRRTQIIPEKTGGNQYDHSQDTVDQELLQGCHIELGRGERIDMQPHGTICRNGNSPERGILVPTIRVLLFLLLQIVTNPTGSYDR